MNSQRIDGALKVIQDIPKLINMVSQRVRQLNTGSTAKVVVLPQMGLGDIALQEIIDGKLSYNEAPAEIVPNLL